MFETRTIVPLIKIPFAGKLVSNVITKSGYLGPS
jgi:hypothetical protein